MIHIPHNSTGAIAAADGAHENVSVCRDARCTSTRTTEDTTDENTRIIQFGVFNRIEIS